MLTSISHSHVFVLDQDEALDFYVGNLGMQVTADVDLGFMRWLTVGVPGQPGRDVLLEIPGPPSMDEASGAQVRELLTKGAMGLGFILTTDDCRKTYDDADGQGRREHPGADRAAVRHRLRDPRSVRQSPPDQPAPERVARNVLSGGTTAAARKRNSARHPWWVPGRAVLRFCARYSVISTR